MTGPAVPAAEVVVGRYWPLHGPYGPARTQAAVSTVAQLVRYLNYATRTPEALPEAGDVYPVLGELAAVSGGLQQLLGQLATRAEALIDDPTMRHTGDRQDRAAGRAAAGAAVEALATAWQAVAVLAGALSAAQSHLAALGHNPGEQS
ncbi:MAG TPA: hypothetical protein VFQ77_08505 [Pseudonocardiaceae bacterium]|nr:hypothetical protein [Pseudonocardiaceae bacterium]